jgi:hypothetical protein
MEITLKVVSENPDGSANAIVNYDEEGLEFLVQEGTTSIIKQYIAQQKGESSVKDIWEVANEIESLACRVSNLKDVIEIVAEDIQDPHSGALWSARDHLEILSEKIEVQVQNLMDIHRDQKVKEVEVTSAVKPKKKKKKEIDTDGRC